MHSKNQGSLKTVLIMLLPPYILPSPPSNAAYEKGMIEIVENEVGNIVCRHIMFTTLLEGGRGKIKIILDCFQIVDYDLTMSLNILCEGL